jgi:hypothetical protein
LVIHFRVRYERLRDRLGSVRRRAALVRAAWLALLVPLIGLGLTIAGGAPLAPRFWLAGAALVFVLAALGWNRSRPPGALDRDLDRRFGLDELLVTAVEVDRRGPRGPIEARLLDDAATAVAEIGGERAIDGRATRREAETLAALGLILVGLWLLAGTLGGLPPMERLPDLGTLDGSGGGTGGGEGDGAGGSGGDGAGGVSPAMGALAGALGDHAAARGIASALAAGDPAAAAKAARSLADRSDSLSPAGRAELARTLGELAESLRPDNPELAEALASAARALADPAADSPAAGIEQLAGALGAMALADSRDAPPPVDPRARAGPPAERLAVRPTPPGQVSPPQAPRPGLSSGPATRPLSPATTARTEAETAPVRGGAVTAARPAAVGADPLRYPWVLREMVKRYFDPR